MRQLERGGQSLFPSGQEAGCEYLINSHQYAGGFTVVCCGTQTPSGEPNAQTRAMEHEHSSTESGCDTNRVEVPRWASRLLSLFFCCHSKLCHTAYGRRVFFLLPVNLSEYKPSYHPASLPTPTPSPFHHHMNLYLWPSCPLVALSSCVRF